jgi:Domain of unknown function (DUF4282)
LNSVASLPFDNWSKVANLQSNYFLSDKKTCSSLWSNSSKAKLKLIAAEICRLDGRLQMSRYFSFQKLISTWFVQVMYFVGFLLISTAGIGLAVWAGLHLRDATISRELGWRYVAAGVGALILGNLLWRVFCECWIVMFRLRDELVAIRHTIGGPRVYASEPPIEEYEHVDVAGEPRALEVIDNQPLDETHQTHRGSSVLGLS